MSIAIISDTHFGDPKCVLIKYNDAGKPVLGSRYEEFKEAAGTDNKYLILLGDIFDFSITSYEDAYEVAKVFFLKIKEDKIADEIIFVPGNHDTDLWHTVEHQVNTINKIAAGKPPKPFRMSVPAILDYRAGTKEPDFTLAGVTAKTKKDAPKYAGLFLDNITAKKENGNIVGTTKFNFAYPNVYLVTDEDSVLITHGHYLETYWAIGAELPLKVAPGDLGDLIEDGAMDLRDMVALNFPLSQLACSGIGQADRLTDLIRKLQRAVKDNKTKIVKPYLDNLDNAVDDLTRFPWYERYKEWITDAISNHLKKKALETVKDYNQTRFNKDFMNKPEVRKRFNNFYNASAREIDRLNSNPKYNYNIPPPLKVIFGHTHEPTPWGDPDAPPSDPLPAAGKKRVTLYNTGGWLTKGDGSFCGAEVITYRKDKGFKSASIR